MKKLTTFLALLAGLFMSSSAMAVDYLVSNPSNPVQVTDLSTLSDDSYYVLQNNQSKKFIYSTLKDNEVGFKTDIDYTCLVRLIYKNDILHIQQVCTGTYYQGVENQQRLKLGEEPADYTFNTETIGTNAVPAGCFRIAYNGNIFLNRDDNDTYPKGFTGAGPYSIYKIYKVDVTETELITDLSHVSKDGFYVLQNVGTCAFPCSETNGKTGIKISYDLSCVLHLNYNSEAQTMQFQQVCNDKYYQGLTNAQLELGNEPADYEVVAIPEAGVFRFTSNGFNLHRNATNYPIGAGSGATGDYSRWRISEVTEVPLTFDESTDMTSTISFYNGLDTKSYEEKGLKIDVILNRSIKEGYNTVVLPFDLSAEQVEEVFGEGATVYAYSEESEDANQVTVSFNSTESGIAANVPVLVKATKASSSNTIAGATIVYAESPVAEGNYVDFVGVYDAATVAEGDYFIGGGALYKSEGNTSIKPFRAYLQVKDEAAEVKLFIDGMATGIESINGTAKAEDGHIYSLAGQRVGKAQKGIYIVNGKKVVVK